MFSYSLERAAGKFTVTPEGHILVNDMIDRETQDSYSFQVSGLLVTHSDLSAHVLSNLGHLLFVSNWPAGSVSPKWDAAELRTASGQTELAIE